MTSTKSPGIYGKLLELPLLRGASATKLADIIGRFKLHFFKAAPYAAVITRGQQCSSMVFVLSGSVKLTMGNDDGSFTMTQSLEAPQVISPDSLFGLDTTYKLDVIAGPDGAGFVEFSKEDYRRMLSLDPVFLFNYLNMVCAGAQRSRNGLIAITGGSALERLSYWLMTLSQPGATDLELKSTSRELHAMMSIPAPAFRQAVDKLAPNASLIDPYTLRIASRDSLLTL